ncbi:hypothetical protein CMV_026710 [Castanea mollissima]|uniref:Uncharacterized protein n=1 Tax=Castanea mollissima TaxID=60419 RepID=A0A8J4V3I2_9ROSI|nr:hypothetical protein CMV_026710 [Castanea mollissima]
MWKVKEHRVKKVKEMNPNPPKRWVLTRFHLKKCTPRLLILKTLLVQDVEGCMLMLMLINSISTNSDGETFISADDL